jgi:hypothetical protein
MRTGHLRAKKKRKKIVVPDAGEMAAANEDMDEADITLKVESLRKCVSLAKKAYESKAGYVSTITKLMAKCDQERMRSWTRKPDDLLKELSAVIGALDVAVASLTDIESVADLAKAEAVIALNVQMLKDECKRSCEKMVNSLNILSLAKTANNRQDYMQRRHKVLKVIFRVVVYFANVKCLCCPLYFVYSYGPTI